MERFARAVIALRIPILLLIATGTAFFAWRLPTLTADDDVMKFLPQDDPDIQLFNKVNERFGGLDVAIVGVESEHMFTKGTLELVRALTRRIGGVDGVFDVLSFTEVPDPRPSALGLEVEQLVDHVPEDPAALAALEKKVLSNENAVGNLISDDGRAAMILCFLGGPRPPMHVAADIKEAASGLWTEEPIYFGGAPFIRLHVAGGTKEDIKRLTPIVALVVLLVTFLIFRKPVGVLLALGTVGLALVGVMGLLAVRGKGVTVVGSSLPTLLVAIGGAYGIHVLAAYFSGSADTVEERIVEALKEVGAPVAASAATTCAGFLSFVAMDMAPMREFGVIAAVGVGLTGILSLTAIPAILSFGKRVPSSLGAVLLARPLGKLGSWAVRNRAWAIGVSLALAIAGLGGVSRLAPDATLETFFGEGSEPDRANRFLERHFDGSVYLQVYFEGDMRSPFVLAQLRKVVEYARGREEVVVVSSIVDHLAMMSEAMGGRPDLPLSRERTRVLYPFLEGSAAIDQMISPRKDASLVQMRLRNVGPESVNRVVEEMRAFIDEEVPRGIKAVKLADLPADELSERREQIAMDVAGRVLALARIHGISPRGERTLDRVAEAIAETTGSEEIEPGDDLDAAVLKVVEEHVVGEYTPFEPPSEETDPEAVEEWAARGARCNAALSELARGSLDAAAVEEALSAALPLTVARDPEGARLAAEAMAGGLGQARRTIRATRAVQPVLAAAGIRSAERDLRERVAWAMTDLDVPEYGFPDSGQNASTVLARVSGQPVTNVVLCESTIRNQLRSAGVALVVLLLIMSTVFRSVVAAAKGILPTLLVLCLAVGVMGAADIPIDLTTSMIAAIALGIGVDYAIHFLWRRRRRGESLEMTSAHVGPSIASNALQVAAGFSVLTLSDVALMQRFGLLVAMTMLLTAAATFVLLPALRAEGAPSGAEDLARDEAETVPTSPR